MYKIYLQNQDKSNFLICDEFFDIPLYQERNWDILAEEEPESQLEIMKSKYQIEERSYHMNIVKETTLDYCQKSGRRISFLPLLRSHIVFCWALPIEFGVQDFLQLIKRFNNDIRFVRVIYDLGSNPKKKPFSYSVILYFKGQVAADDFYQELNCENIGSSGEALYLAFLSKVHFIKRDFEIEKHEESLLLDGCVELPKCPVCLERLDGSVTGISFEMMKKEVEYDDEERWKKAREACNTCQKIKKFSSSTPRRNFEPEDGFTEERKSEKEPHEHENHAKDGTFCETCGDSPFSWVCLICGNVGCGRYHSGHAKDHYTSSKHAFCLELESLRIWDYLQDMYVHRIVRSREHMILSLPDTGESGSDVNEKIFRERMDMIIWEYNYLLGTQLEEQRKYYEEKLASLKKDKEESPRVKKNNELIEKLKAGREEMKRRTEENEKESKLYLKKTKMANEKIASNKAEMEQIRFFNQSMQENLIMSQKEEKVKHVSPEIEKEREKLKQLQEKLEALYSKLDN